MIDQGRRRKNDEARQKVRSRIQRRMDTENYEFIPAKKQIDYYDNDVAQRVAVYARVSTDNIQQTTSYELQKKYYEDFVVRHPNWTLVRIYADATVIIGLKQNPTYGRRFSPIFLFIRAFCGAKRKMLL